MALSENNYFGRILKAIFERIKSDVPEIRWIAEDIGQLEETTFRPSVCFPCALIDFPNTTYSSQNEKIQTGVPTITVRLGFNPFQNANAEAPDSSLEHSLERFEIEQKVVNALHGWGLGDLFQDLNREFIGTEKRSDGLRVRALTFTSSYSDESQQPEIIKAPATAKVKFTPS